MTWLYTKHQHLAVRAPNQSQRTYFEPSQIVVMAYVHDALRRILSADAARPDMDEYNKLKQHNSNKQLKHKRIP